MIHGCYKESLIPLVYALLPNKTKATYTRLLRVLLDNTGDFHPTNFTVDFEDGFIGAIVKVHPRCEINGCNVNFSQCISRNVQLCGLSTLYNNNAEFAHQIKHLAALAYVPVREVGNYCDTLLASKFFLDNFDVLKPLALEYFEKTWVGEKERNLRRKEPVFAIEHWNVYNATLNKAPGTNNGVEGCNFGFTFLFDRDYVCFWTFVQALQKEQDSVENKIAKLDAGQPAAKRKAKYVRRDERLKRIAESFDTTRPLDYLNNIAHIITI